MQIRARHLVSAIFATLLASSAATAAAQPLPLPGLPSLPLPRPPAPPPAGASWATYPVIAQEVVTDQLRAWIANAEVRSGRVEGPVAVITQGSLTGPSLATLETDIVSKLKQRGFSDVVALATGKAVAAGWSSWTSKYEARNPAAFPIYAGYPVPFAPDHPALPPFPLRLGKSTGEIELSPPRLSATILGRLGAQASEPGAAAAVSAFSAAFGLRFQAWLAAASFVNLWGGGWSKIAPLPGPIFGTLHGRNVILAPPL
jgi:hypothetical protein